MKMTKTDLALLMLVSAGLWEREPDVRDLLPLTAEEWRMVWRAARQQTVSGLAYRGLVHLPTHLLPPDELLFRWVAEADRIETLSRRHNECVGELIAMFRSHGLRPVLLKGQGTASLYEWPLLREAGDIDLYFSSPQERAEAIGILKEKGICPKCAADGSVGYIYKGIEVEHHAHFAALCSPKARRYLHIMEEECGFAEGLLAGDRERTVMLPSPMLHLVLLNAHILHHAMGRGIGLRQLCDMARACYALMPLVDNYRLLQAYSSLRLLRWSGLLHSFLVQYLGLSPDRLPHGGGKFAQAETFVSSAPLLRIILQGGNFGRHDSGAKPLQNSRWRCEFPGSREGADSGATGHSSSHFAHKMRTVGAFVRRWPFSLRFAPQETLATMATLIKGQ